MSATVMPSATSSSTLRALLGFSIGLLMCLAAAAALETRLLEGTNVWLKPAKFALSFVVLYATLAWVVERLSPRVQERRLLRYTLMAMVLATWTEMAYIAGRAGLGQASHFAVATPTQALMYSLMGVGAVTLVVGIAVIGWLAGNDVEGRLSPLMREGVRWGFGLSSVLTLLTAGYLASNGGHFVGVPSLEAAVIPGLGWSAEVGDLRPAHFLALHAMQAIPLVAWVQARRGASPKAVKILAIVYTLFTLAVFAQALMGEPLIRL